MMKLIQDCIRDNQDLNEFKIHMIMRLSIPCKINKTEGIVLICFLVNILFMNSHPMIKRTASNLIMKASYPENNLGRS